MFKTQAVLYDLILACFLKSFPICVLLVQFIPTTLAYLLFFGLVKLILTSGASHTIFFCTFVIFPQVVTYFFTYYKFFFRFSPSWNAFLNSLYKTPPITFLTCPVFYLCLHGLSSILKFQQHEQELFYIVSHCVPCSITHKYLFMNIKYI